MQRNQVFPYYREYVKDLASCYEVIKEQQVVGTYTDLSVMRGYPEGYEQYNLLKDMNMCAYQILDASVLGDRRRELGVVTDIDSYLLDGRYVIEVHSPAGDLLTLIGYYPDYKKYITVPTKCFSKELLFFNIDNALQLSWTKYNGLVFLVEGIFDCLSLRAIGLPAVATMGNNVEQVKLQVLKMFRKVAYIPDNDKTGRRALDRNDIKHGWKVPFNAVALKLQGDYVMDDGEKVFVKDIDKAIALYDAQSLKDLLLDLASSPNEIEVLQL